MMRACKTEHPRSVWLVWTNQQYDSLRSRMLIYIKEILLSLYAYQSSDRHHLDDCMQIGRDRGAIASVIGVGVQTINVYAI